MDSRIIPRLVEKVTFGLRQSPGIEIVEEGSRITAIQPPSSTTQSRELLRQPKSNFFNQTRYIMLAVSLVAFVAYPFLSANDRKQVAPLATPINETEEQQEADDDEDPVMMEDEDDEVADLQLSNENLYIRSKASDVQIGKEHEQVKNSASDPQISNEDDIEEDY